MKNKVIFGSILAVTVLIGVSFTSVVGYRSVNSDVKVSPLFNIRSSRAIDEESEGLTCDYVGKGEKINILIPTRNNRNELFDRYVEIIGKIDDKSYDRFVYLIFKYLYTRDDFQEHQIEELILYLGKLGNNPNKATPCIQDGEKSNLLHSYYCTLGFPGCPSPSIKEYGYLPCLLFYFLLIIILLIIG